MIKELNRKSLASVLGIAGATVFLVPVLLGLDLPSIGAISSNAMGVVMMLAAAGLAYGNMAFWSAFALGAGAWTLVASVVLGFHHGGGAFWTHMTAGFVWMLVGLAGHDFF